MPRLYSVWQPGERRYHVYETGEPRPDYNLRPPLPSEPPLTQLGDPPESFLQPLPFGARLVGASDAPQGSIAAPRTGWGTWAFSVLAFVAIVWAGARSR